MSTKIISKQIKELRQTLNLTQKEMAESLNITAAALSKYESEIAKPSINVLIAMAEKYNVSVDWLLGLNNNSIAKVKTYSDVLESIFQLSISPLDLTIVFSDIYVTSLKTYNPVHVDISKIQIIDDVLADMLYKFNKTYELYKKGVVDLDVLQAVVDSLKKENKSNEITPPKYEHYE